MDRKVILAHLYLNMLNVVERLEMQVGDIDKVMDAHDLAWENMTDDELLVELHKIEVWLKESEKLVNNC